MVPSAFVRLDALPLTPNGKLDRRALPTPDAQAFAHQAYEAPQGELETTLAEIWIELLGVEQVGRHDSFFALGGHSLLAVQLIERLRQRGLGVSVRALFDTPVLSALAQTLSQHRDVVVPPNVITPEITALTPEMLPLIKAMFHSREHHIMHDVPAVAAGRRRPVRCLAVAAVKRKRSRGIPNVSHGFPAPQPTLDVIRMGFCRSASMWPAPGTVKCCFVGARR